jgi:hypothetical protein
MTVDQAVNSAMAEPQAVYNRGNYQGEDYWGYWNYVNSEPTYDGFYGRVGEYKGSYFGYGEFGWGCFGTDEEAWASAQAVYAPQTGHAGQRYVTNPYQWWSRGELRNTWVVTNAGAARTGAFNSDSSTVFRYDKYEGSVEQKWANLSKNKLPIGNVDPSTGKLQMGKSANGDFFLRETQNVRDSNLNVIGEYITGLSGSGDSVRADSYVSYKVTHPTGQAAMASGVLPRYAATAPEVGVLDTSSGRLMIGILGGDRVSRFTHDILDPATGEVIASVPKMGKAEAERAVAGAAEAFKTWKKKSAKEYRTKRNGLEACKEPLNSSTN